MDNFLSTYQKLNANNLELLSDIYESQIIFVDPAHKIEGLQRLKEYFNKMYMNISQINFDFRHQMQLDDSGYVQWTMSFAHPSMKKGQIIDVEGATYIRFTKSGKAIYHRDYFDLGSMIYQHIPVLGRVIKTINRRLGT